MNADVEQTLVTGVFGTVTTKRVIYQRSKGWLSGGSREDIPLKHVTSVRLDVSRHVLGDMLLLLIGFPILFTPDVGRQLVGAIFLLLAGLLLWGSPTVVVNTAGQDKSASKGWPWDRPVAAQFVEAVRNQLVNQ